MAGGVYALLADRFHQPIRQIPLPPAVRAASIGSLYGLLVWTASYLGWLPAVGILAPATRHPARRNALMIVAHLIWSATLGLLVERTADR
jgi:putative membrane protein